MKVSLNLVKFLFSVGITIALLVSSFFSISEFASFEEIADVKLGHANSTSEIDLGGNSPILVTNKEGHTINLIQTIGDSFRDIFLFEITISVFTGILSYTEWKSIKNEAKKQ